jgi:RNA polymerase sigma-70 factor (ECF subfamily)
MAALAALRVSGSTAETAPAARACASAYRRGLMRYFARRAPAVDVEDLVQEVYLRLQAAHPTSPILDLERYLFTIARHVLASRHRRLVAQRAALSEPTQAAEEVATDLSPERIVAARQDVARALAAVSDLPPRARAAFQLHRLEDLTYADIADRMRISRASVKELLRRAKAKVGRAALEIDPNTPPAFKSGASKGAGTGRTARRRSPAAS